MKKIGAKIFISYRRSDSPAVTGRIYDNLSKAFGRRNVFKDVDSISPGAQFDEVIEKALKAADILLAIIGPKWVRATDDDGSPRIQNPDDFVRKEVLAAKNLGLRIIPILVDGAMMPKEEEVPSELVFLCRCNALPVRNDPDFGRDMESLISTISRRQRYSNVAVVAAITLSLSVAFFGFAGGSLVAPPNSDFNHKKGSATLPPVLDAEVPIITQQHQRVRLALVIGNQAYEPRLPDLQNSTHDAEAIANCLKSKGFRLLPAQIDKSTVEIRAALRDFQTLLALGGTGIVFYAGHGIQIEGEDYIVPVGAVIESMDDVRLHCINVSEIMRPVDRKLEEAPQRSGDLIIYSTSKGEVAMDGTGQNSPFTRCLIEASQIDDYEIFDLFRHLCKHVPSETGGLQTPWMSASTSVEFYLNKPERDRDIGILKMLIFDTCRDNPLFRERTR